MINVIGLGSAGCSLAETLSQYAQYNVYKLDVGLPRKGNTYPIKAQATHEEYDKSEIKLSQFVSRMKKSDSLLFILGGGGKISGSSLQILKQLHGKYRTNIDIMYIKPDTEMLSDLARKMDRICYGVLQQYARSGVFRSILLLSNPHIEQVLGSVPVKKYYQNLNNFIAYAYHMVNVFTHTEPVIASSSNQRGEHVRIWTIGTLDLEKKEEKLFFPLDKMSDRCYYYGINEQRLETDGNLLKEIRNQIKQKSLEDEVSSSYAIHSTAYEEDMAYVVCWSSQIQKFPEE